jgi:hypothetical protein
MPRSPSSCARRCRPASVWRTPPPEGGAGAGRVRTTGRRRR